MGQRERILLAEGGDRLRKLVKDNLERNGHTVTADTGYIGEFQEIVDDPTREFGVAVISGHLPVAGQGEEAAAYLRERRPEVVIVAFSGNRQTFGDYYVPKGEGVDLLPRTIRRIPRPHQPSR